jgi:hypothetical protein
MRLKSRTRQSNPYFFTTGTTLATALPANPQREILIFQNIGSYQANIGFSPLVTGAGGTVVGYPGLTYGGSSSAIQLGTAASFIVEQHTGPVYVYGVGGSASLSITELVESGTATLLPGTTTNTYIATIGGGSVFQSRV